MSDEQPTRPDAADAPPAMPQAVPETDAERRALLGKAALWASLVPVAVTLFDPRQAKADISGGFE